MSFDPANANAAAPASTPVYCYAIEYTATNEWAYLTRWDKSIVMTGLPSQLGGGDKTFIAAQITHNEIEHSGAFEGKGVVVNVSVSNRSLQRYFLTASTVKIRIYIIRVTTKFLLEGVPVNYAADAQLVESGVVGTLGMSGLSIQASITPEPFVGTNQVPRYFFGRTCQKVFGPRCGVDLEALKTTTTILETNRDQRMITVDAVMIGANYWTSGNFLHVPSSMRVFIEWADNEGTAGKARVRLRAWSSEFQVGDMVTIYPGCSLTVASCTLFGNVANFGGCPYVPEVNPVTHGA